MREIGQDRTLLLATCMVLGSHMQTNQGKQRRAGEKTRGEESNSEIRTACCLRALASNSYIAVTSCKTLG